MENRGDQVPITLMCEERMFFLNKKENLDQISCLPDYIIYIILDSLPLKDAARTCILSKAWKSVCSSYPILHFDHNLFGLNVLLAAERGQEPDISEIRERFLDFVDFHLSNVRQQALRMVALNVAVGDSKCFSRVDHLMDLVMKLSKVEELHLFIQTDDCRWKSNKTREHFEHDLCYKVPFRVLASKGLHSLSLRGCKFASFVGDHINNTMLVPFSSLQRLCLSHVVFDEDLLFNLTRCCPGTEILEFDCCTFCIEFLHLSIFPKLKKASFLQNGGWPYMTIDLPGLQSFKCQGGTTECEFIAAACGSIKELTLSYCIVPDPNLILDLTNTFPLLEEAEICMEVGGTERLYAANHHLRRLDFSMSGSEVPVKEISLDCPNLEWLSFQGWGVKEAHINCPNLKHFFYVGNAVPALHLFNSSTGLKDIYFRVALAHDLNMPLFIRLRGLIEQMAKAGRVIHLHLRFDSKVEFVPKESGAIQASPQRNVHLEVWFPFNDSRSRNNVGALVDGLIWSTQPTTFTVYGFCDDLCEDMYAKIAKVSRDETCKGFCNKCWWHHLQDFEMESSFTSSFFKGSWAYYFTMFRKSRSKSTFKFYWRFNQDSNAPKHSIKRLSAPVMHEYFNHKKVPIQCRGMVWGEILCGLKVLCSISILFLLAVFSLVLF